MKYYKVTRDVAKNLFIRLLYFGGFSQWKLDNHVKTDVELPFLSDLKH